MDVRASSYEAKPWLRLYDPGQPAEIVPDYTDTLAMFRSGVSRAPQAPAILYFDGSLTYADVDRLSDALAAELEASGFVRGDRLAIYLQNVPQFPIAVIAAWKAGGVAVPVNPMNRDREIGILFDDCTPRALICHGSLYEQFVTKLGPERHRPPIVITTTAREFQTRNDPRLFADTEPSSFADTLDFSDIVRRR
jgi:long-chain acyl-CoA synthetase